MRVRRFAVLMAATLLGLSLSGCSKVQDAKDTATGGVAIGVKATQCAQLAADAVQALQAAQTDPSSAQGVATDLEAKVKNVDDSAVKAAALRLSVAVQKLAKTKSTDTAQFTKAQDDAVAAAKSTAEACGIPASAFTGTS